MIERNFNLHLTAGHSTALVINANQFDQGEKWIFTLYNENGTQYIPSTGAIVGIKSDGLGIINSGSVVDGKVVIMETEQMTAAVGKAVFELMIDSQTHGTANFIVLVEPKPGNNADLSESDLSLLQEAIDATSPLPTGGTVGQVLTKTANGSTWSNAGTPTQEQVADAVSDWADEHITVSTGVVIDTSLSVAGAAADAKKTGDEITDLKSAIAQGGGFTAEVKQALMNLANAVAFKGNDPTGQTIIDALEDALYPPTNLSSISAVYTQSGTVYNTDSLDSLKSDLVVTAHYDDYSTETVTSYVLSGTLTAGTSTITVAYGGKTTTFDVTVTHEPTALYPLENVARTEFTTVGSATNTGAITITNGKHVKIEAIDIQRDVVGLNFNMTSFDSNNNEVNNLSTAFTIPANVPVVLEYKNFVGDSFSKQMNTRKAGASQSGSFATGAQTGLSDIIISKTLEAAENVGCIFGFFAPATGQSVEFDVSLTVDGERWI